MVLCKSFHRSTLHPDTNLKEIIIQSPDYILLEVDAFTSLTQMIYLFCMYRLH